MKMKTSNIPVYKGAYWQRGGSAGNLFGWYYAYVSMGNIIFYTLNPTV